MMGEYIEAAEACRKLREEYEAEAKKLDPLRWQLIEAQTRAEALWSSVRDKMMRENVHNSKKN